MRLQLVLIVLLFLPLMVKGQTDQTVATPVGVKYFSAGPTYVAYKSSNTDGTASSSTTLYIQGSAQFTNGASITQKGRTELTGDFINGMDPSKTSTYPNLFIKDANVSSITEGVIAFIGTNNKQSIKRADAYSTVSPTGVDKPTQKAVNYITFPTISVEKMSTSPFDQKALDPRKYNYLAIDSSAAIMVDYLRVPQYNRFSVEGGYSASNPSKLNMGQALIKQVSVDDANIYSQVNLNLYNYVKNGANSSVFTSSHEVDATIADRTLVNSLGENYMTGFTPPFKELGSDYMFYHVLTKPSSSSFNSWAGNIVDPYTKLIPGYGYFMSMEVTDFDHVDDINPRWDHDMGPNGNTHRARGGYVFNRGIMADYLHPGYSYDDSNAMDYNQYGFSRFAYTGGVLTTTPGTSAKGYRDRRELMDNEKFVLDDVTVTLRRGFNFLGNPFMAPISLNYLLGVGYTDPTTSTAYAEVANMDDPTARPLFGSNIYASALNIGDGTLNVLRSKFWIINNASVKYKSSDGLMHFKATYDYISRNTGTTGAIFKTQDAANDDAGNSDVITSISPDKYLIAPMQMFGLQSSGDFDITLSAKLRTLGVTRFQKSSTTSISDLVKDFLVVEVVSPVEKTADRAAVVLREGANLKYAGDAYDTRKGISKTMETYNDVTLSDGKNRAYPDPSTSIVYTKSTDGESLLGNGVPMNTKEVPLFVTPPATQQTLTLNFYNLKNMVSVPNVWLIDRYENNKTVKLTEGYSYSFTSGPSDLNNTENRFILRFWGDDEDIIKDKDKIACYYNTSILHISGLTEEDMNSDVQVFDLQGRLIGRTKVNSAPSMEYLKPLSLGTYIVKITGKRNFTSKFVNLQN